MISLKSKQFKRVSKADQEKWNQRLKACRIPDDEIRKSIHDEAIRKAKCWSLARYRVLD